MRFTTILAGSSAIALGNAAPVAQSEGVVPNVHHHGMGVEKQLTPFITDETKYPFHVRPTRTTKGHVPTATHGMIVQPPSQGAEVYVPDPDDSNPVRPRSEESVLYKAQRYHTKGNATRPGSVTLPTYKITDPDMKRPALRKPGIDTFRFLYALRRLFPWLDRDALLDSISGEVPWNNAKHGPKGTGEKASTTMTAGPKETGKKHFTMAWKKHSTTMAHGPEETGEKASTTMTAEPKETGKKHWTTMAWKKHSTTMAHGPEETGETQL